MPKPQKRYVILAIEVDGGQEEVNARLLEVGALLSSTEAKSWRVHAATTMHLPKELR